MMLHLGALLCAFALSPAQINTIDAAVTGELAREHIAGMSVGIARNGAPLLLRGYGMRDLAADQPVDAQTVFEIGSLSKQFTAAAILLAQGDGSLALQAPLSRYVPEYKAAAAVTVRELLDQTSGIPDFSADPSFDGWLGAEQTPDQVLARVRDLPLHFPPGTQFEYSNTNYLLLGMILQRTTAMPYRDFLNARIFTPLHLRNTFEGVTNPRPGDVARGYAWEDDEFIPAGEPARGVALGAGGLSSNVPDLIAWQTALYGGAVLSPHATRLMLQDTGGYAFGLMHRRIYGREVASHTGNLPGFASYAGTLPQSGLQIVLLANSLADLQPLATSIIGLVAPALDGGEDPAVTALVADAVTQSAELRAYGAPQAFTFLDRPGSRGAALVRYRIAFENATVVATFAVNATHAILLRTERIK